jgi:outer membrane protein
VKRNATPLLLLTALLFLFAPALQSQTLKIGWVDSQKLIKDYPDAQKARKDIEARVKIWKDSIDAMDAKLKAAYDTYQRQESQMNDAAKKEQQQILLRQQKELQDYSQQKSTEAAQLEADMFKPITERILKAIEDVAKEEKLTFIFDKSREGSAMVLYAEPKLEYTAKVLDRLVRGN